MQIDKFKAEKIIRQKKTEKIDKKTIATAI